MATCQGALSRLPSTKHLHTWSHWTGELDAEMENSKCIFHIELVVLNLNLGLQSPEESESVG